MDNECKVKLEEKFKVEMTMETHVKVEEISEPLSDNPRHHDSQFENIRSFYKNFMVLVSGWLVKYFRSAHREGTLDLHTLTEFFSVIRATPPNKVIIEPPRAPILSRSHNGQPRVRARQGKRVYVSLAVLSELLRNEVLKPWMDDFLTSRILRYIIMSKSSSRKCVIRFLPVLKQGLIDGGITNLR